MNNPWKNPPDGLQKSKWYYSPWFVLFMILFVLGPFALPLLYKSPRFSLRSKIIWTVLTLALLYFTLAGILKAYEALKPIYHSLIQAYTS